MEIKKIIVLSVVFIQIILSGYIVNKESSGAQVCSINNKDTCGSVVNSNYGKIFGIKVSLLGVIAFSILFVLGLLFFDKLFFGVLLVLGSLVAIYLLIVQGFFLKQFCLFCTITDVLMILNTIYYWVL